MVRKAAVASDPDELTYTIRNKDGEVVDEYILKVPSGPIGWQHFLILMEVENARKSGISEWRKDTRQFITVTREDPKTKEWKDIVIDNPTYNMDIEVDLPNPKLDEIMSKMMDKWVNEILPKILVGKEFNDIKWYHILNLFEMACKNASIDTANFRTDN